MLVIGTKPQESILIGEDVVVTLLSIGKTHARLGVVAPKNTPVSRDKGTVAKIHHLIAAGVPLNAIEQRLDHEENADRMSGRDHSASRMTPDEDDQISRPCCPVPSPRMQAMHKQLRSMEVELDCLRADKEYLLAEREALAKTVAELQEALATL